MFGGLLFAIMFRFYSASTKRKHILLQIKNKHKLLFQTLSHTFNIGLFINQPQASEYFFCATISL